MKKSCYKCEFLIHYGGNEYGCKHNEECIVTNKDIIRPSKESLLRDARDPFSRYRIPKIIHD